MEPGRLRYLLRPEVMALNLKCTHATLTSVLENLGLPNLGVLGSKSDRIGVSFDAVPQVDLPRVAERFLRCYPPGASVRNEIQDALWSSIGVPEIPRRYRRDVARAIAIEDICLDAQQLDRLLDDLWVLDNDPFGIISGADRSLRRAIDQHVFRNPGDWSTEELFGELGAFEASDRRFALFLEGLASSLVRPEESAQREFVHIVNNALRPCGVEMRESGTEGGYPLFKIASTHAAAPGRPKNIIFASSTKPDIRFRDALNNDIEIVTNADKVLVYDRSIGPDGVRWRDLQAWWAEKNGLSDENEAKKTLYRRLLNSLPKNSPPQALFFRSFFSAFSASVPDLPALLPEVWLHWDAKTVKERGALALLRFRMDFLLLFPHGVRVVVEVDGKHHYADDNGLADGACYSAMLAGDRELKLAGYHVFRFGAEELQGKSGAERVNHFFEALFRQYGVDVAGLRGVVAKKP